MKTLAFCFGLIILSISFMGCEKDYLQVTPSDQILTRDHVITDFAELNISDPFQVYIRFSDTGRQLSIEANSNLHSLIKVKQINGVLSIQLDDDIQLREGTPVLNVFLTTGDLQAITAQGAAEIHLQDPWSEDRVNVELTGASSLEGLLNTDQLTAELTGASMLDIGGSTGFFDLQATGASNVTGYDFAADKLTADLTGGCRVALTVNQELRVTATGASKVYYRGQGSVAFQNLTGGSEIIRE